MAKTKRLSMDTPSPDLETQFQPAKDGEDNMWEVEAILDERGPRQEGEYLVQWSGVDPSTGEPWDPSWEPKGNCSDILISEWKQKKKRNPLIVGKEGEKLANKLKERNKKEKQKRKRTSSVTASRKRGAGTPSNPLRLESSSPEASVISNESPSGAGRQNASPRPIATRSTRRSTGAASVSPVKAGPSKLPKQLASAADEDEDEDDVPVSKKASVRPPSTASSRGSGRLPSKVSVEISHPSASKKHVRISTPPLNPGSTGEVIVIDVEGDDGEGAILDISPAVEDEDIPVRLAQQTSIRQPATKAADRRKRINISSSKTPAAARPTSRSNSAGPQANPPAEPPLPSSPATRHTHTQDPIEDFSSPDQTPLRKKPIRGPEKIAARPTGKETAAAAESSKATAEAPDDLNGEDEAGPPPNIVKRIVDGEEVWVNADEYDAETLATSAQPMVVEESVTEEVVMVVEDMDADTPIDSQSLDKQPVVEPRTITPASSANAAVTRTSTAGPGVTTDPQLLADLDRLTEQTRVLFRDLETERAQTNKLREEMAELRGRPAPEPVIVERVVERIVERLKTPPPAPPPTGEVSMVSATMGAVSQDLVSVQQQLDGNIKALRKAHEETDFIRGLYTQASDSAVAQAARVRELEAEVKKLQTQLSLGLKQRHTHFEAIAAARTAEADRLRMQNKLLLDQARQTDDEVRARAVRLPSALQQIDGMQDTIREMQQTVDRLKSRNEDLVDQVEVLRARQMGVLPDQDERDGESGSETDSEPSHRSRDDLAAQGYRVREFTGLTTVTTTIGPTSSGTFQIASPGPVGPSYDSTTIGRVGGAEGPLASQGLVEGGEHYECQWQLDGNKPCPVSTDTTQAMVDHVERVHSAGQAAGKANFALSA